MLYYCQIYLTSIKVGGFMIGAIIGDIVGSVYEFNNVKSKRFKWFAKGCRITDDTVLTVAVADALLDIATANDEASFKELLIDKFHYHARNHLLCGFGARFLSWVSKQQRTPYNSFGNGSAMRVSPAAYAASTLEEALYLAKLCAEITHDHPEGIKGAQCTAGAIFLAKIGYSKEDIRAFAEKYYDLSFTLDEIRPVYKYEISCQGSVPQAIVAFLEAKNFKDAISNAISIGGDSDTIAAITGSVAGAYYPISEKLRKKAFSYLDFEATDIILRFEEKFIK